MLLNKLYEFENKFSTFVKQKWKKYLDLDIEKVQLITLKFILLLDYLQIRSVNIFDYRKIWTLYIQFS